MYSKYGTLVKEYVLDQESATIFQDFKHYYEENPAATSIVEGDYFAWTRTKRHATDQHHVQQSLEKAVGEILRIPPVGEAIVNRFIDLDYASQIGGIVDAVIEGKGRRTLSDIGPLLSEYGTARTVGAADVVTSDLDELLATTVKSGGVEWRLEDLNRSIGPLRRGDFVLIGKRPEVGGTSFVSSELTHMVPQLPPDTHGVFFNNEEVGQKIGLRLYQTALGATAHDLTTGGKSKYEPLYKAALGGRRIDVVHRPGMTAGYIEGVLRSGRYGLIVLNTLAKVGGFEKLEGVARMEALGQWARKMADQYGVVIAVHQADNTAEGVEYLDQSQLYGSKTGLQGETDVQIMIGKSHNPAKGDVRYLSVVRNKIPGGPRTKYQAHVCITVRRECTKCGLPKFKVVKDPTFRALRANELPAR
jgi:hypothetical protein